MAQTNEEEHGASEPKKPFRPFPNQAPPDPLSRTWLDRYDPNCPYKSGDECTDPETGTTYIYFPRQWPWPQRYELVEQWHDMGRMR